MLWNLEIFSSVSCKAFMIIRSQVIMVSTKLSLSSDKSILGPMFRILWQIMFNHALLVLDLKPNIINHMVYPDNFMFCSSPRNLSPWTSLNNYLTLKAIPLSWTASPSLVRSNTQYNYIHSISQTIHHPCLL